ncbi:MAG: UPF0223 family protein [Bacilli bacterium]|nr:UPF0223 family protein [Bacilli bacterium]
MEQDYKIDYEMFTTIEITKIIDFFMLIEQTKYKKISKEKMISRYREYQKILNNKTLEKQYDKMLFDRIKISIYQTMKNYLEK